MPELVQIMNDQGLPPVEATNSIDPRPTETVDFLGSGLSNIKTAQHTDDISESNNLFAPEGITDSGAEELLRINNDAVQVGLRRFITNTLSEYEASRNDELIKLSASVLRSNAFKPHGGAEAVRANPTELVAIAFQERIGQLFSKSKDVVSRDNNGAKNSRSVDRGEVFWTAGDLVHSTGAGALSDILATGVLTTELLGDGSRAESDSSPLLADFTEITSSGTYDEVNGNGLYTAGMSMEQKMRDGIIVKFRRDIGSTDFGEEEAYTVTDGHRVIFGGLPATEISGIQLDSTSVDTELVITTIVESGMYVPVYDTEDNLLFTEEEFAIRTGAEIPITAEQQAVNNEQVQESGNQILRIGERFLRLAEVVSRAAKITSEVPAHKSIGEYETDKTTDIVYRSTGNVDNSFKREPLLSINSVNSSKGYYRRANIPLGGSDGEVLQVLEKGGGEIEMFVTSLDAPAKKIEAEDIPAMRDRLASVFMDGRKSLRLDKIRLDIKNAHLPKIWG
jgi:hypothetical protein